LGLIANLPEEPDLSSSPTSTLRSALTDKKWAASSVFFACEARSGNNVSSLSRPAKRPLKITGAVPLPELGVLADSHLNIRTTSSADDRRFSAFFRETFHDNDNPDRAPRSVACISVVLKLHLCRNRHRLLREAAVK
jgi:hypothetical protein